MNAVVSIRRQLPGQSIAERDLQLLKLNEHDAGRSIDRHSELIPQDALPAVIAACEHAIAPVNRKEATTALALILGGYTKADLIDPELWTKLAIGYLADYPLEVLEETIREIHRTLKWLPKISEIVEIADRHLSKVKVRLRTAMAMKREYARRDEEQRKHQEQARVAELALITRQARLLELLGDDAATVEEISIAERRIRCASEFSFRESHLWRTALDAGERWAANLCRRVAALPADAMIRDLVGEALEEQAVARGGPNAAAMAELRCRGTAEAEMAELMAGIVEDKPEALARQDELATAYHARRV